METRWKVVHAFIHQYKQFGAEWAADVLTLKPCDMWQQLRGRTMFIVGDSLSQVCKAAGKTPTLANSICDRWVLEIQRHTITLSLKACSYAWIR